MTMEQRTFGSHHDREDELDERERPADAPDTEADRPEADDRSDFARTEADEADENDTGDAGDRRAQAERERMDGDELDERDRLEEHPAAPEPATAGADEQLTVPEDRDAAAMAEGRSTGTATATAAQRDFELFSSSDVDGYRRRWDTLQASFVDDPSAAAHQAEALVGEMVERVGRRHQELRDELGSRANGGGDATEAMRQALRQYRAFFRSLMGA